jgi:murein DD-endopeptidase MepM/ murein hydrolase activator NlpD
MNNQNERENEKKEGENKEVKRKKVRLSGEKRFYLLTAIGCAVALVAVVIVAIAASVNGSVDQGGVDKKPSVEAPLPDDNKPAGGEEDDNKDDEQVVVTPEGMISPLETVTMLNEHGFYHNKTLNSYYEHKGVDFSAEAGTNVLAVEKGVVESIFTGDVLTGTEIVIKHEDGLKSVYRFVNQVENLKVGDQVGKGQVVATVAEANGSEYKDGAHLHFEILKDGASVDPSIYLTLEEK